MKRFKTKYPGVFYREARRTGGPGTEKVFYVVFKKDGKLLEEKVGRQYADAMTEARANAIRAERIEGKRLSRKEVRERQESEKKTAEAKWTIGRLWGQYEADHPSLKGLRIDRYRFAKFLEPEFGNREPRALIPLDVDRIRVKLQKTQQPKTVSNILELLRRLLRYGERKLLIPPVVFTIQMPRVNNEKTEDLSPDELVRLLEAIKANSHLPAAQMMSLALHTGMRRGEMFKLQWQHVDFERGFIHIRKPKGGVDQTIPLSEPARQVFQSIGKAGELVFPGRKGRQRSSVRTQVNRIKKEAGLPADFRPLHGLRHVYASMLASSGKVDMYTLQKLLTHKSPVMTQRYAHLRDEALRNASDLAGDIIGEAGRKAEERDNVIDMPEQA